LAALAPADAANGRGAPAEKLLFIVACPKDVIMYTDAVPGNETRSGRHHSTGRIWAGWMRQWVGRSPRMQVAV
jgi:hypothetical protein